MIKIKFIGIPNVKRFYYSEGISCDTHKKDTCIIKVTEDKAAQLMVDHPKEWEYITPKGATVIGKQITEYSNKIIAQVASTKGVKVIEKNGKATEVKPKPVIVKKPTKIAKTPKAKK